MRNFIVKNDFNRSSYHKDKKNDYTRAWNLEEELYDDREDLGRDPSGGSTNGSEEDS